jgi:hypothetical protein
MKRILISTVALVAAAGCASSPPTVTQQLLGAWNCDATIGGGSLKGLMTYAEGGKGTVKLNYTGTMGAQPIVAAGDGEATWKLIEGDTKLESTITTVNLTSVKIGDRDVPPAMAQSMLAPMLAGQTATSTIKLDKTNLTLTATDGTVTACTRPIV